MDVQMLIYNVTGKLKALRNRGRSILFFYLLKIVIWLCILHFQNGETGKESEEDKDANKSEISVVFEIALKRNIPVSFEVCVTYLFAKKVLKTPAPKTQCS